MEVEYDVVKGEVEIWPGDTSRGVVKDVRKVLASKRTA